MLVMQPTLFGTTEPGVSGHVQPERVALGGVDAWVDVWREWLVGADSLLVEVLEKVPWERHRRWMYDRAVDDPRLSCWYRRGGDVPVPFFDVLGKTIEDAYGVAMVGPALNYYRDGSDSVAFHSDRELRDLRDTLVAIVTLGATRPFLVRPAAGGRSVDFRPGAGDLLVMGGACQLYFEHAVPKLASCGPRVSASWRWARCKGPRP